MRKNEDQALQTLADNLKVWFQSDFGVEIDSRAVCIYLAKKLTERTESFLDKRLDHLTCEDLVVFSNIWLKPYGITQGQVHTKEAQEADRPIAKQELQASSREVAAKSGVAEAGKTSTSVKGKGVRGK